MDKRIYKKGIYAIRCKVNNKLYIGMTRTSFYHRWRHHLEDLQQNKHSNKALQNDYNQFGAGAFTFRIVEVLDDNKLIEIREKQYINYYAATRKAVYNIRDNLMRVR